MPHISQEGLKRLDTYKYKSGGYSKLDNKMNPFWEWVETKLPKRWAPNLITLIGFIIMAISYFAMLFFDDSFSQELPRWVYIFSATCQFVYQTMDAVDGKRARNTKSSSPLGQLFDHGCDSFSMTFIVLSLCQTIRLGPTIELLFLSGLLQLGFFIANWGEYHSGVLTTSVTYFGVTEMELLAIATLYITGIAGPQVWDFTILGVLQTLGVQVDVKGLSPWTNWILTSYAKIIILRGMSILISLILVYFAITTLKTAKDKWLAVEQFIPVSLLLFGLHLWSYLPIFQIDGAMVILSSALIFSLITCKLIICSLTEMRTRLIQWEVIVFYGFLIVMKFVVPIFHSESLEKMVLYALPIYVIISVMIWAHGVITEISTHLGIHCFSLEKKTKKAE